MSKDSFSVHPRTQARDCVFQGLYAYEISKENDPKSFSYHLKKFSLDKTTENFATSLYFKTLEENDTLKETIEEFLENWDLNRIALLDKLILKMSVCELLFFDDVPPIVSISEAIELAEKYSTDESSGFVNGVLDSIFRKKIEIKKEK